jgi:tetratricopeptide (TPR) repeat protein
MGFFDLFSRSAKRSADDPDALREELFATVASGDMRQAERLCRANDAAIIEHFGSWQKVPDALRSRPEDMQRYAHGLIGVAQLFASALGRQELLERLTGLEQSNPLIQWQEALGRARELMDQLQLEDAMELLTELIPKVQTLEGTGAQKYLPITYGFVSECLFHLGRAEQAAEPAARALELCERSGDGEGMKAYLRHLYEIHRYLDQGSLASDYAGRLAAALRASGNASEASWFDKQAVLVAAGEPLNRVIVDVGEERYERDAVPPLQTGRARFVFERNRISLRTADAAVQRGEELGGQGDYTRALAAFQEAARADPFDPRPRYLAAFTLLHLGRYAKAIEEYRATEELAPGWYHCRADLCVAEALLAGRIDRRGFTAWVALEDGGGSPSEELELAGMAVDAFPDFAPFLLYYGKALAALDHGEQAEDAFRSGLHASPDDGTCTRLLVELAQYVQAAERKALLEAAVALDGDRVAAAMASVMLAAGEPAGP